jgi:hypothetical protein
MLWAVGIRYARLSLLENSKDVGKCGVAPAWKEKRRVAETAVGGVASLHA